MNVSLLCGDPGMCRRPQNPRTCWRDWPGNVPGSSRRSWNVFPVGGMSGRSAKPAANVVKFVSVIVLKGKFNLKITSVSKASSLNKKVKKVFSHKLSFQLTN